VTLHDGAYLEIILTIAQTDTPRHMFRRSLFTKVIPRKYSKRSSQESIPKIFITSNALISTQEK
jgi:hypothetical protein